jgi:hypothetical protein
MRSDLTSYDLWINVSQELSKLTILRFRKNAGVIMHELISEKYARVFFEEGI